MLLLNKIIKRNVKELSKLAKYNNVRNRFCPFPL